MLKKHGRQQKTLIVGLCLCLILSIGLSPAKADLETKDKNLKGEVEQIEDNNPNLSAPSAGNMDNTRSDNSYIRGRVQQEDIGTIKENPESGEEDPDVQDKELMIEWDHWRNRFLQAVLSGTTDCLNSDQAQNFQFNSQRNMIESKYPMGTNAWFSCRVTRDRQIKNVQIEHPSGFAAYDQAVREAVQSLAGSAILTFPSRSRRVSVLQAGGVERTAQVNKQYFRFGDTEHYRVPSY